MLTEQPPLFMATFLSLMMLIGWIQQCRSANAGPVDALWAAGIALSALVYGIAAAVEGVLGAGQWFAVIIACAWFARLASHLFKRTWGETEDGRYQAIREHFGSRTNLFHFFFYQFQAALSWLFALPVFLITQADPISLSWPVILGVMIAIVAFFGETIADAQLARFKSDPANRGFTCREGLWRYSRHPNYFFEWLHWFCYPLIGLSVTGWLWLYPVLMLLFLIFITGIPYTEKQALKSRGDDYRRYQQETSAFIPWRPKCHH